jgi:hypothetical protein
MKVRVYLHGAFMYEMDCPKYEPYSNRDQVCRFFPLEPYHEPKGELCTEEPNYSGYLCYGSKEVNHEGELMDCYRCASRYACKDFENGRTEICSEFEREWHKEDGEPIQQGARGWSYFYGFKKNMGEDVHEAHPALYSYELAEAVLRELGFPEVVFRR